MTTSVNNIITTIIKPALEEEALREAAGKLGLNIDGAFTLREREEFVSALVKSILEQIADQKITEPIDIPTTYEPIILQKINEKKICEITTKAIDQQDLSFEEIGHLLNNVTSYVKSFFSTERYF